MAKITTQQIDHILRKIGLHVHALSNVAPKMKIGSSENLWIVENEHQHEIDVQQLGVEMEQIRSQIEALHLDDHETAKPEERLAQIQGQLKIYEDFVNKVQTIRESLQSAHEVLGMDMRMVAHSYYAMLFRILQKCQYWLKSSEAFLYTMSADPKEGTKDSTFLQLEHAQKRIELEVDTMTRIVTQNQRAVQDLRMQPERPTHQRLRLHG